MDYETFQRVLRSFADRPSDIEFDRDTVVLEIRNEIIEVTVSQRPEGLTVVEDDQKWPASQWICERIGQLPLLANRIAEIIDDERFFVSPCGEFLDDVNESPEEQLRHIDDIPDELIKILDKKPAGTTCVTYLTSDAGEGKTTLINHAAVRQAKRYQRRETDWLLLPVALGGRTFMRFDDVIVGTLMNRLRFNVLYYDSFIELVRVGAIVPALDGFEEMFVEGSAGDAISALGNLMQAMQSSGASVIAARKAYFQYKNLRAQTKLLDSMSGQSVSFSRIGICRWNREQFLAYASKRQIGEAEAIYEQVASHLGSDHPLLTRAVLVERLIDIAEEVEERATLLERIKDNPSDYFRQFIGSIIEREANRKWLDKSGEPAQPLLSVEEHYELLSELALEMWTNGTTHLPQDVMIFVAEIFAESRKKNRVITQQIIERLSQHALIDASEKGRYRFDHEEFFHFFVGEAIGRIIVKGDVIFLRRALSQSPLPQMSQESAARFIHRNELDSGTFTSTVNEAFSGEPRISLTKENLCGLIIHVFDLGEIGGVVISDGAFPADALNGKNVSDVTFEGCYFQKTSLYDSRLENCVFEKCELDGLECNDTTKIENVTLQDCKVVSFCPNNDDLAEYTPERIEKRMSEFGFVVTQSEPIAENAAQDIGVPDQEIEIIERALRAFIRATGVNENTFRKRLGPQASHFLDEMVPELINVGVLKETAFRGAGVQKRFKLNTSFERLASAIESCQGRYERFLNNFRGPNNAEQVN